MPKVLELLQRNKDGAWSVSNEIAHSQKGLSPHF